MKRKSENSKASFKKRRVNDVHFEGKEAEINDAITFLTNLPGECDFSERT